MERFWVIGGDFSCLEFKTLRQGTQMILGPFENRVEAQAEWRRLSFENKTRATTRFSIVTERVALAA